MEDSNPSLNDSAAPQVAGKIMVGAMIILSIVVTIVVVLRLCAKRCWSQIEDPEIASWRGHRRRRFVFAPGQDPPAMAAQRRGLDRSTLQSLPFVVYNPKEFKDGLECAVCLCELSEGEKARLLPKCNHGFHVECIDMWFQSHSTCPLCRNPVVSQSHSNSVSVEIPESFIQSTMDDSAYASVRSTEMQNFPTNVLFWGDGTQVSSLGSSTEEGQDQALSQAATAAASSTSSSSNMVIDIPRHPSKDCSSSSPSAPRFAEEEAKSPMTSQLRMLRRLLTRGKRVAPSPGGGSSSGNVEQASYS
ncbi:hypothetical protein Ancab_029277 [Ancistrocladus abbreviatus]